MRKVLNAEFHSGILQKRQPSVVTAHAAHFQPGVSAFAKRPQEAKHKTATPCIPVRGSRVPGV